MRYLIGLLSFVFLFSVLAYAQEAGTEDATTGLQVKGIPVRSALSPNASVPNKISYQGVLTTTGGAPVVDGAYELKFELFNVSGGGGAQWSETQPGVNVYKGTFSVLLGSVTPLSGIFYQPLWVEVTAVSGPGIAAPILFTPRTELASAAYSLGPWYSEAESIWVTDTKNVGINTTSPQFALDVHQVSGATTAKFGSTDALYFIRNNPIVGFNTYYEGGFRYGSTNQGGATIAYDQDVNNGFSFNTAPDGMADQLVTLTPRMTIREDGKVGIGTVAPDKLLEVAGSVHVDDTLFVGSPTQNGVLNLYQNGTTPPTLFVGPFSTSGGQLQLKEEGGTTYLYGQPDASGTGGYFEVTRTTGVNGFIVDGNYSSTEQPRVGIYGSSRSAIFSMNQTANSSVVLPDSSISAAEMFNEPGIAEQNVNASVFLTTTTMVNVETISITIPAAGYIVVEAKSIAFFGGVTGNNQLFAQIDETSGGSFDSPYWIRAGLVAYPTTGSYSYLPIYVTRTYYKLSGGTYTFILEAQEDAGNASGNSCGLYQTQLTAIYYPTAYGPVQTLTHGTVFSEPNEEAGPPTQIQDLRELELAVARAQAEVARAERELLEAQTEQRQSNGSEPR